MILKRSPREQKRRDRTPLVVFILLFPYIAGYTSDSTSTYTETLFGIGTGQYVYHDCSGVHSQRFSDAGLYYGKKFEGPYRLGLSAGGWTAGKKGDFVFIYPDLALDWEKFSVGTTGIRIGPKLGTYFEVRSLDQPPLLSGKGAVRAGLSGKINESGSRLWFGVNALPYNKLGFATQLEFPYGGNTFLFVNGRWGMDSGLEEYGISIGMRLVSF